MNLNSHKENKVIQTITKKIEKLGSCYNEHIMDQISKYIFLYSVYNFFYKDVKFTATLSLHKNFLN